MERKEVPLLYSMEMVKAKLAMRKTETRRMRGLDKVNVAPGVWKAVGKPFKRNQDTFVNFLERNGFGKIEVKCPCKVGDLIWGRETWQLIVEDMDAEEWTEIVRYAADNPEPIYERDGDGFQIFNKDGSEKFIGFKPSIHMPKYLARIWDEVVEVRVERLWDITEEGAVAEGIIEASKDGKLYKYGLDSWAWSDWCYTAKTAYRELWMQINGADSWEANPWVWVIVTKQLTVTGKPVENE